MPDEVLTMPDSVAPCDLEVNVHAVHYTDVNQFGAYMVVRGDNDLIISEDGSIHLFFSPEGFRNLLKTMVEVLVFKPEEVNEQSEEVPAEAAAQGSDDSEGV